MTKMPLVSLGLTEGQNPYKTTLFIVLNQTRAFLRILATLTKLTWSLLLRAPKTLILIWPLERVETNVIAKIIKFSVQ